jgi:tetratricopeptide (TPR) repeat protein
VDEDFDVFNDGTPHPRLVRAVRQSRDADIWAMVQRPELLGLQSEFLGYMASNQIQSSGDQFSISSLYGAAADVDGVGLTSMFFGFRKLAANFLWMQVDTFWHIGEMHRMVPLMRTCVTLDPNFIDAYLLGAWHLAYNIPAKIEPTPEPLKKFIPKYNRRLGLREEWYYTGADFLRDGIRKNPRDYRLYFDLGYSIYEQKLGDHKNAILYLDEARRHKHDRWVPRMLFRSLMLNGQYEDAIEGWDEYLQDYPGHDIGRRFLRVNKGYLADAIADEALECSAAASKAIDEFSQLRQAAMDEGDNEEADRLNGEIQKAAEFVTRMDARAVSETEIAFNIWVSLSEVDDDPLARGRIARRKAFVLKQQGRYVLAVAELDLIRWQDLQFFDEASDLIIEIKQEGGIPLSVSERAHILRVEEAKPFIDEDDIEEPIRQIECPYMTDAA